MRQGCDPCEGPDLSVEIGGVRLKNPVLTASGTCGYGLELAPFLDLSRLGGFTTKSVTLEPRMGNPPERIVETPGGMLNAIGLANVGLERFMTEKVPELDKLGTAVFVNVAGHRLEDYVEVCRRVDTLADVGRGTSVVGVELNVSCPNVDDGLVFGTDPAALRGLVAAVRAVVQRGVLMVKLSPNVTDITATARAAIDGGADALSMINTYQGMAIDVATGRPALGNVTGGVSGPAIKPMAIHLVHRVWSEVAWEAGVPIVGMGGIATWRDAAEFMLAGASAVAVGTTLFGDPASPIGIIEGLSGYLADRGFASVRDLVGAMVKEPGSSPSGG